MELWRVLGQFCNIRIIINLYAWEKYHNIPTAQKPDNYNKNVGKLKIVNYIIAILDCGVLDGTTKLFPTKLYIDKITHRQIYICT